MDDPRAVWIDVGPVNDRRVFDLSRQLPTALWRPATDGIPKRRYLSGSRRKTTQVRAMCFGFEELGFKSSSMRGSGLPTN